MNKYLTLGLLLTSSIILTGCCCCCSDGTSNNSEGSMELNAQVLCRQVIRQNLKAPSTANFSGDSVSTDNNKGKQIFIVTGYVDAENSFGAKLRSSYECSIDSDTNNVINFKID